VWANGSPRSENDSEEEDGGWRYLILLLTAQAPACFDGDLSTSMEQCTKVKTPVSEVLFPLKWMLFNYLWGYFFQGSFDL